jgi:hypothetical protein
MSASEASDDDFNTYAPGHMPMPDFEALARDIQNRASCRGGAATTETRHFREFFGTSVLVVGGTPPSGGDGGGGKEARGIPGRGEEDKYRGRKVQGGVDEAQRGREEEEGKSVGGRAWDGVPGASSGAVDDGDGQGPDDRATDAPPSRFGEGSLSSLPSLIVAYPWMAMA